MDEAARQARNQERIGQCWGPFGAAIRRVLDTLEAQGQRPRIQHAWRSVPEQLELFNKGFTRTKFGFHNVTAAGGAMESLACDVLDDDNPLSPPTSYLLRLAAASRAQGLETGILWDVPPSLAAGIEAALATGAFDAAVKVGWDPTHVQPVGMRPADAKNGVRPNLGGGAPVVAASGQPGTTGGGCTRTHVVQRGQTLGGIAKANGLSLQQIIALNPAVAANPNLIRVGQELCVASG